MRGMPFFQRMRRRSVVTPIGIFSAGDRWEDVINKTGLQDATERTALVRVNDDCWIDTRLFSDGRLVAFEITRDNGPYIITRIDIKRE